MVGSQDRGASQRSGWLGISLSYVPRSRRHHAAHKRKLVSVLHFCQRRSITNMISLVLRVMHIRVGAGFGLSEISCMRCGVAMETREPALSCLLHPRSQQKNTSGFSTRLQWGEPLKWIGSGTLLELDGKEGCAWGYLDSKGHCKVFFQLGKGD